MSRATWLQNGPFGVMVHYLPHVCDRQLKTEPDWDTAVARFDMTRFCDTLQEAGAGWVFFPFGQNCGPYCCPNPVIERLVGTGWSTKRDLMGDLAQELQKRALPLIGYLPSEMWCREESMQHAFGWDIEDYSKTVFQQNWQAAIRYWGEQFGEQLAGWWFDGCYEACKMSWMPAEKAHWDSRRFIKDAWFGAARAGNPNRSVAMNPGANRMTCVFEDEEDYLSGEINDLLPPPETLPRQMLPQGLLWLDCFWMHTMDAYKPEARTGRIPAPRFKLEDVRELAQAYSKRGGGLTLNIGIYRDGTLAEDSVEFLRNLSR